MWTEPLMTGQRIQQEAICYQWFKQRLMLSVSEPSISQRSQIKEDTVKPSVPAREFNLKAYTAITWHNDPASLGLKPRLIDHRSEAARTAMLPIAPPRQVWSHIFKAEITFKKHVRWSTSTTNNFAIVFAVNVSNAEFTLSGIRHYKFCYDKLGFSNV